MGLPRLVIAGTHSGVGKTTVATGIMAALARRGLAVQGFKVGPDYIDPGYHTGATGRVSRNLDVWLQGDYLVPSYQKATVGADIAVVEGVMGLFDGIKGQKLTGSSAHVASLLKAPVVLIVDVKSSAYSTGALVHGFASFDPMVKIAGVILNRVGSQSHLEMVKEAVESLNIPVLGHLGREEKLTLPERHLGLVPMTERGSSQHEYFDHLAQVVEEGLDLDRMIEFAQSAPPLVWAPPAGICRFDRIPSRPRIAVAKDEAFSFYYQDTLDLFTALGAEVVDFSPVHDHNLPQGTRGIFIGGGFPESFLTELAANHFMHDSLRQANSQGIPIYAECGGLMYLCREITGFNGETFASVGLVPGSCSMTRKLQGMGYREGSFLQDNILGVKGDVVRGHEFHYSSLEYDPSTPAYRLATANRKDKGTEGYVGNSLLASYLHLNFAGNPVLAANFLKACGKGRGVA